MSTKVIDEIIDFSCCNGAKGGKVLGAGGGGFVLLFVPIDKQKQLLKKLRRFVHVPFKFENNG